MKPKNFPSVAISFEGRALPLACKFLDVAKKANCVSEETSIWFFHFCVCAGRTRSAPASDVILHASALAAAIEAQKDEMRAVICRGFSGEEDAEVMIADWLSGLTIMLEAARGKSECTWYGQIADPKSARSVHDTEASH